MHSEFEIKFWKNIFAQGKIRLCDGMSVSIISQNIFNGAVAQKVVFNIGGHTRGSLDIQKLQESLLKDDDFSIVPNLLDSVTRAIILHGMGPFHRISISYVDSNIKYRVERASINSNEKDFKSGSIEYQPLTDWQSSEADAIMEALKVIIKFND